MAQGRCKGNDCACQSGHAVVLCDVVLGVATEFLRSYCMDCAGLTTATDTGLDGVTPYAVLGDVQLCAGEAGEDNDSGLLMLCDVVIEDDGSPTITPFLRRIVLDSDGGVAVVVDTTLDGVTVYVPLGEVTSCDVTPDTCCCESFQLCDQGMILQPVDIGDYENLPYPLAPGPTGGLLPVTGVNWTVDSGAMGGSSTYLFNNGTTQLWTFDVPVMVRFGIRNLNAGNECVDLPEGILVESLHANHSYNPVTRRICNGGSAAATDTSIFVMGPVTEVPLFSTPTGGGSRGTNFFQVALPVYRLGSQPFMRKICSGGLIVTDTLVDGITPYTVVGEVIVCQEAAAGTLNTIVTTTAGSDNVGANTVHAVMVVVPTGVATEIGGVAFPPGNYTFSGDAGQNNLGALTIGPSTGGSAIIARQVY